MTYVCTRQRGSAQALWWEPYDAPGAMMARERAATADVDAPRPPPSLPCRMTLTVGRIKNSNVSVMYHITLDYELIKNVWSDCLL